MDMDLLLRNMLCRELHSAEHSSPNVSAVPLHLRKTRTLMARCDLQALADQNRNQEAERLDAIGYLADLPLGMHGSIPLGRYARI
jgi:hypothetical protein